LKSVARLSHLEDRSAGMFIVVVLIMAAIWAVAIYQANFTPDAKAYWSRRKKVLKEIREGKRSGDIPDPHYPDWG